MANSATIASLEVIIRARLNLTNVNTITSAEVRTFIRSSLASLYELICNRHKDYYVTPFRFSFATNVDRYPLPTDFRSCVQVFITFGSSPNIQRLPLECFTLNRYQTSNASTYLNPQWPTMYRIMGNQIWFTPAPGDDYHNAVEMFYIPQFIGPVSDNVTIDAQLPNGWETWVEYDTCAQIAMRLRIAEYYAMYAKERDSVEQAIISAASVRDESPQYMTDAFDVPWFGLNVPGET